MKLSYQIFFPVLVGMLGSSLMAQRIVVDSADPPSTFQGTTLNVTIRGKGFSPGAISKFLVTATNSTGRVTVHSTTFISSTALVANITAAEDAVISLYDIAVTSNGRTGKGIEKFSVQKKTGGEEIVPIILGLPEGCASDGTVRGMRRMNNGSDLLTLEFPANFSACPESSYLWSGGSWLPLDLPVGMTGGEAHDVSDDGAVVGRSWCIDERGATCAPSRAFFKRDNEPSQLLPNIGAGSTSTTVISSNGLFIAGTNWAESGAPDPQAILWMWDESTESWLTDVLGPGDTSSVSDDGNRVSGYYQLVEDGPQYGVVWERSSSTEPFETLELGPGRFPLEFAPSGEIFAGFRRLEVCSNRRCTKTTLKDVPVFWSLDQDGRWQMQDLPSSADLCRVFGVAEVGGRGPVFVGICSGAAVAWLLNSNGSFGEPIILPNGAIAWGINRHGWILGEAQLLEGRRAVLWKLP